MPKLHEASDDTWNLPCATPHPCGSHGDSEKAGQASAPLRLINLWRHEGRRMARWSPSSRKTLSAGPQKLWNRLKPVLSRLCTHVKGRGGVKGSVRELKKQISGFCFAARFDVASYCDSMRHSILMDLLVKAGVDEPLRALVRQYLEAPDLNLT